MITDKSISFDVLLKDFITGNDSNEAREFMDAYTRNIHPITKEEDTNLYRTLFKFAQYPDYRVGRELIGDEQTKKSLFRLVATGCDDIPVTATPMAQIKNQQTDLNSEAHKACNQ